MKKTTVTFLILMIMVVSLSGNVYGEELNDFKDMNTHWSKEAVNDLVSKEIINGYKDNTFKPNNNITRAEFVKLVFKATDQKLLEGNIFEDTKGHWAKDYIHTLVTIKGIDKEEYGDYYKPNKDITRLEMTKMIIRSFGFDESAKMFAGEKTIFDDDNKISYNDKGYVTVANQINIVSGYPDNTFKPDGDATRAEASMLISKALTILSKKNNENIDMTKNYNQINNLNFNMFNTDGKYLYYSNGKDKSSLYRMSLKTGQKNQISELRDAFRIQLTEDYIVFSFWNDELGKANIAKTDYAGNLLKTYNIYPRRMQVVRNTLIVMDNEEDSILKINLDNDEINDLNINTSDIAINDDFLFYTTDNEIKKMNIETERKTTFKKGDVPISLSIFDDSLIFTDFFNRQEIVEKTISNDNKTIYKLKDSLNSYLTTEDFIYYTKESDLGLYSFNKETLKEEKLFDKEVSFLNLIGNKIYFYNGYGGTIYYYDIENNKINEL
jgi:hypothetical protein